VSGYTTIDGQRTTPLVRIKAPGAMFAAVFMGGMLAVICMVLGVFLGLPFMFLVAVGCILVSPFFRDPGDWQGECPKCYTVQRVKNDYKVHAFGCGGCGTVIEVRDGRFRTPSRRPI